MVVGYGLDVAEEGVGEVPVLRGAEEPGEEDSRWRSLNDL